MTRRLNYANVMASLAVILALGGTATAAITLPNDSVGAPQIQTDAVRAPEVQTDAIRSPEIQADAVRSSEILNDTITLADISDDAQAALDEPRVRIDEAVSDYFAVCAGPLEFCPNLASISLPEGRWLVQAKFSVLGFLGLGITCGLVESDTTTLDSAHNVGLGTENFGSEQVSLMDVMTTTPGVESTTVAVRCTQDEVTQNLSQADMVLTAVEVKPLTSE